MEVVCRVDAGEKVCEAGTMGFGAVESILEIFWRPGNGMEDGEGPRVAVV
jgi:hypothetical protein